MRRMWIAVALAAVLLVGRLSFLEWIYSKEILNEYLEEFNSRNIILNIETGEVTEVEL